MKTNKPTPVTPFEKAEASRTEHIQRIAGTILVSTWMARKHELRKARKRMTSTEKIQWDLAMQLAAEVQYERFGYDA